MRVVWEWNNDPAVRNQSFHAENIAWEEHERWFSERMKDEQSFLLIAEFVGEPIGLIRFQLQADEATVSVVLDEKFRGMGLGSEMIRRGVSELWRETNANEVIAEVKAGNSISAHAFQRAGFSVIRETPHGTCFALRRG